MQRSRGKGWGKGESRVDRSITLRLSIRYWIAAFAFASCAAVESRADILPSQVLVVYNSITASGTELKDYYLAAHPDIPAANVLDLQTAQLNIYEITYANFVTLVRTPIRNYLLQPGGPEPSTIVAICLIRPFPHRLLDTDMPDSGDGPSLAANEILAGDATNCSLDAELTLLWQNLDAGEAGGVMDSKSDNVIDNPYHKLTAGIQTFSRANIQVQKTFTNQSNVCWLLGGAGATRLTPGDMYLVSRIDGNSVADAKLCVDRAAGLYINKAVVKVLFDEHDTSAGGQFDADGLFSNGPADPFWGGNDYELARDALIAAGWNVRYDATFDFIDSTEETGQLIGYASYGENHQASGDGEDPPGSSAYLSGFNFAPGAMFNTLESYNARALGGLLPFFDQEQVGNFVAAGGTFGVGSVWEPFSFTVPDNAFLMPNLLVNGLTWAEAAYTSLPALSWQQLALGDPLAKPAIIFDPGLPKGDMDGNGIVDGRDIKWFINVVMNGLLPYRAAFPSLDPIARGDFTGDRKVAPEDATGFTSALLGLP